jgi:hypothetical protein
VNDDDLRDAFVRLREADSRAIPPFRVRTSAGRPMRLAVAAAMLLLVVSVVWLTRPQHHEPLTTSSLSTWQAPTDFLLDTPGRELLNSTPQLKPEIPGGRS